MKSRFYGVFNTTLVVLTALVLRACQSERSGSTAALGPPEFSLQPSATQIMAGQTVTVAAESENVAAGQADIQWAAMGGDLAIDDNGRIARVRFDKPGTYYISATLSVGDMAVETEATTITVSPFRER